LGHAVIAALHEEARRERHAATRSHPNDDGITNQRLDDTYKALSIVAVLGEAKVPATVRKRILAALRRRGVFRTPEDKVEC